MRALVSARIFSASRRRSPSPFMSRTRANFCRESLKISSICMRCASLGLRSDWMRVRNCCTAAPPACWAGASPFFGFSGNDPAGRQRNAAFGTFNALSRLSTAMRTLAVIPGSSAMSGFAAEITTV